MQMTVDDDILLNQLAQGIVPVESGVEWLRTVSSPQEVLRTLAVFLIEAGGREEDVPVAITRAGVRATYTPSVLLSRGRLAIQLAKVLQLPAEEYEKSFRLLVALLAIADERRRGTRCAAGCTHWWHRDLTNPLVIRDIKTEYE